jgi:hypothetical protein
MRFASYRPSLLDHLPKTRRGHGTTHPFDRVSRKTGLMSRRRCACVQPTCERNLPTGKDGKPHGEEHENKADNAKDWKIDHKVPETRPFERCFW